jgi:hypothetical protein
VEEAFVDLKEGMEDALVFERSKHRNPRVTGIQAQRPLKAS